MATPLNGSVVKAFRILDAFDKPGAALTATELSKRLELNVASVHRFLVTLESVNAVCRVRSGRFQLGGALVDLGNRVDFHNFLASVVQPTMTSLVAEFQEIAHATVLKDGEVVYIAKATSSRSLSIQTHVGKRLPAYCTGVGKVLLAFLPKEELSNYLKSTPRVAHTSRTIVNDQALLDELECIRDCGHATDNGEMEEGLKCVAVPVFDRNRRCVAALSVSAPETRLPDSHIGPLQRRLNEHARNVEKHLACEDPVSPLANRD